MTVYEGNVEKFRAYCDKQTFDQIVDYGTVQQLLQHSTDAYAQRTAVSDEAETTFSELGADAAVLRGALRDAGVSKGDLVGILLPNSYDAVKAFFATVTAGAVAVLFPVQLPPQAIMGCTMKYNLKAIITSEEMAPKTELAKSTKPSLAIVNPGQSAQPCGMTDVEPSDPCAMLFTSGTTGQSKGVLLSHRAITTGAKNGCYGYPDVFFQRYVLVLPLTHIFGLIRNLMTSIYTGSAIRICRNPKDMFKDIAIFRPSILVLVPALVEMALNLSRQLGRNLFGKDVKTIICGAAMVPPYLVREYDKFGIKLLPGYGLTESANLVSGNPESDLHPESVGYIYPGMQAKVVDGELWIKGPNVMDCYLNDPKETEASFSDGWFRTGDLVRFDEDQRLYITGRLKELIVLATGENISPQEIENTFDMIDDIQDCLVTHRTENGMDILTLEVLPRMANLKAKGIQDVEGHLREEINEVNSQLPSHCRINRIVIRDKDFARSPSMKVLRNQPE